MPPDAPSSPSGSASAAARPSRAGSSGPSASRTACVRGDDLDRITGLDLGADDHLAKPCNPRGLVARVHVLLRRSWWSEGQPAAGPARQHRFVTFAGFRLDLEGHVLSAPDGAAVRLTMGEI